MIEQQKLLCTATAHALHTYDSTIQFGWTSNYVEREREKENKSERERFRFFSRMHTKSNA